jgi:acyl-CoA thioesterase FadM
VPDSGLYVSLWTAGWLGWRPPGLTARLEVDYKKPLPSDSLIKCTVQLEEVDKRKVWMRATISDGTSGKHCASAKALFVSPRWSSTLRRLIPGLKEAS